MQRARASAAMVLATKLLGDNDYQLSVVLWIVLKTTVTNNYDFYASQSL